tara:strand:+ start:1554 stop:2435 length:882 start_codon:yes stop_codon:yes gene_type:complete
MSSGGGTTQTSGEVIPYAPTEPYLQDILQQAENIYQSDVGKSYFPSSTVVPFAPQTQAALNLMEAQSFDQMGGSALYDKSADIYGKFASGDMPSAYSQLTPQADYLSGVRAGISSDVMGNIQSQFGGMGRTGTSPGAQQAMARGFTTAYAPIAQGAAEAERTRELQSLESGLGRQFRAAGALPGIQQAMDRRIQGGISGLGGVGGAYEELAGRQMQDQINRFNFEQQSPYARLAAYSQMVNPIAGMGYAGTSYQPDASPLLSGLTGAALGSQLSFLGPLGPILGGIGGLTGLL